MVITDYKNDGWGISVLGFEKIYERLNEIDFSMFSKYNIIEFGSGTSTKFFVDYIQEKNLKNVFITSFENDTKYATKARHEQLDLKFRKLMTCSDTDYDEMFKKKGFNQNKMSYLISEPQARQKNCFYDIEENDIPNQVDFVLLDGPSGNGRNFAFLHLLGKLQKDSIVFIDDFNHYDFLEKFLLLHNGIEIVRNVEPNDRFVMLKVKNN